MRDKNLAVVCWTDSAVYANQVIFFSTYAAAQPVHSVYCGRAHTARRGTTTPVQRRRREAVVSTSPKRNYIYPAGQAGRRAGRYTCTIKMVDINKWTGGYQEGKSHPVLVKRDWIPRYLMMPQPIAAAAPPQLPSTCLAWPSSFIPLCCKEHSFMKTTLYKTISLVYNQAPLGGVEKNARKLMTGHT